MTNFRISLTPNEAEALKRIYVDEDDETKRIEYIRFTTDVDKVFTVKVKNQTIRTLKNNPISIVANYL